jgi:hypothetical protein
LPIDFAYDNPFKLNIMNLRTNKKKIPLSFVVYFLLLALFPSIHCHADESQCITDTAICGISFIKPIPSDYSCCEVHSANHDSQHDHHTHFLLEEARTNNRSNEVQKSESLNQTGIIKDQTALYLKPLFVNISRNNIAKSVDGFHALYSGLSPPII